MELNPNLSWISGCISLILIVGILIYLPVKCTTNQQEQSTIQVKAACEGNLKDDTARAIACAMAIRNASIHNGQ